MARDILETEIPTIDLPDFRGFEWYYLWLWCHQDQVTLAPSGSRIAPLAYTPDGTELAAGDCVIGAPAPDVTSFWAIASAMRRMSSGLMPVWLMDHPSP